MKEVVANLHFQLTLKKKFVKLFSVLGTMIVVRIFVMMECAMQMVILQHST